VNKTKAVNNMGRAEKDEDRVIAGAIAGGILGVAVGGPQGAVIGAIIGALLAESTNE